VIPTPRRSHHSANLSLAGTMASLFGVLHCVLPWLAVQAARLGAEEPLAELGSGAVAGLECPSEADWIVVGGGGAGCAAAAALADAGQEVVVLERGPSDRDVPSTQTMSGWPRSVRDAGELVRFTEGVWGVVGEVLGGGTALNGGLFLADSAEWFARHLPGVDSSRIATAYKSLLGQLASPSQPTDFGLAWDAAMTEAGYGAANLTHPQLEWSSAGQPYLPYSTYNQTAPGAPRVGAATLLHRRMELPNLRVLTHAKVHRILFSGRRAVGVQVALGRYGQRWCGNVRARRGVVVSAGAIYTPQLLQVSGVGPRWLLEKLGVRVVSELPVGENFVDRLVVPVGFLSPTEVNLTVGYTIAAVPEVHAVIEGVGGGDITSVLGVVSLALVPPQQRGAYLRPILKTLFDLLPRKILDRVNRMIQPVALQMDTHSRGSVQARWAGMHGTPQVSANYFADPRDWQSQQQRFDALWALSRTRALADYTTTEKSGWSALLKLLETLAPALLPCTRCLFETPDNKDERIALPCLPSPIGDAAARKRYLQDYLTSSYHYFGTAAAGSVVDATDFGVLGTQSLHVVDASVMPVPTTVNPQGTVMALGHYLGTLLAERR